MLFSENTFQSVGFFILLNELVSSKRICMALCREIHYFIVLLAPQFGALCSDNWVYPQNRVIYIILKCQFHFYFILNDMLSNNNKIKTFIIVFYIIIYT